MRYAFRDIEIDDACFAVKRNGRLVAIQPRVFDLLIYLLDRRERMVPSGELMDRVWRGTTVGRSALGRCICLARSSVGDVRAIRTVHARGYQWVMPVSIDSSQQRQYQSLPAPSSVAFGAGTESSHCQYTDPITDPVTTPSHTR
jgi:DNA-binding winged helix-turn-helix (wHTH) protein